jgi:hypothetical protein
LTAAFISILTSLRIRTASGRLLTLQKMDHRKNILLSHTNQAGTGR